MFFIFLLLSLLIFVNTLYYTLSLLVFVSLVLLWLMSIGVVSTLTVLAIVIVYFGAMIVVVGYICAVSPNLYLSSASPLPFILVFSFLFVMGSIEVWFTSTTLSPLFSVFFGSWGVVLFIVLVTMLFLILLMVTTQYSVPNGPFRSV